MTTKNYPQRGITYSLRYIMTELELRDAPCLMFMHEDKRIPIQDSHCTDEDFLSNAEFADTNWTYQLETDEWIPVFHLARGETLGDLVTVVPDRDYQTGEPDGEWLAFPTHCPTKTSYEYRVENEAARSAEKEPADETFAESLNAMDAGIDAMRGENQKLREQR